VPSNSARLRNGASRGGPDPKMQRTGMLAVVLQQWMTSLDLNATALQCWTSIQANCGINACTIWA
jgi:L-fucose isomerase-like protein